MNKRISMLIIFVMLAVLFTPSTSFAQEIELASSISTAEKESTENQASSSVAIVPLVNMFTPLTRCYSYESSEEANLYEVFNTDEIFKHAIKSKFKDRKNKPISTNPEKIQQITTYEGAVLNAHIGVVQGPSGKETYYNLPMDGVIRNMRSRGYTYEYSIREDGVKMFGPYVMCAANLDERPFGTILETSLGTAIVCDTGEFALVDPMQLDIAVEW